MLLKNIINYEERKRLHQENGQRTELLHNNSSISTMEGLGQLNIMQLDSLDILIDDEIQDFNKRN